MEEQTVYSVSNLNQLVKGVLEGMPALQHISVKGELSNYSVNSRSGHHYFKLKDAGSMIDCVMYSFDARKLRFVPENGMSVVVRGAVSLYLPRGGYQLRVVGMTVQGHGDILEQLEQLRKRLLEEGLFERSHKKALPAYPRTIAVITSDTGDAVMDIIHVTDERWPLAKIVVLPVRVQGAEAPGEIAAALRNANRWKVADVIITGRGGGGDEDLSAFNDERVVRAVYDSEIPVITCVGHTMNETLADLAADFSETTPTNAAQKALRTSRDQLLEKLREYALRCDQTLRKQLENERRTLRNIASRPVMASPTAYIQQRRNGLDMQRVRLLSAQKRRLDRLHNSVSCTAASMDALSPLKVLGRGYAVATRSDGSVLRSVTETAPGEHIDLTLRDGELNCLVENRKENDNG